MSKRLPTHREPDRRSLLKGAAAMTAATVCGLPRGVFAETTGPETTKAVLGYIALTDAAPLIVAKEKGLFAKYGMPDVEVVKQASWGATRDNLLLGGAANGVDGAHLLTPMPYLIATGKVTQNHAPTPMYILARLNLDCQGVSVSNEYKDLKATVRAGALKAAFARKKAEGKEIKVAMTFPGGTHDLWLRYWLAAAGIDPDKDVSTIVVPPPQMVANMKVGNMDAFCVGEPWNEQLVNQGVGYTACTTGEIWPKHPEKALGMRAEWVDKNPKAAKALVAAVIDAQQWCDRNENKAEVAEILGRRQWLNAPVSDIVGRLKGDINYGDGRLEKNTSYGMKFWRDNASYPFKSHDAWFVTEEIRWGKLDQKTDIKGLVAMVNREDIWRNAAKVAGVSAKEIPASTSRGKETFFDGKVFDPDRPSDYLKTQSIKRAEA